MKECPKCKTIYTDTTLSYCLSDGSALSGDIREEQTEAFSVSEQETDFSQANPTEILREEQTTDETIIRSTPVSNSEGVSRGWIFATFGLLSLLLIGSVVVWFVISRSPVPATANTGNLNANTSEENRGDIEKTGKGSLLETETPDKKTSSIYRVRGVRSNDVLYIRPSPGNLKSYVGKIPPDGTGIKIIGPRKKVRRSTWVKILYRGKTGWVNSKFLKRQENPN